MPAWRLHETALGAAVATRKISAICAARTFAGCSLPGSVSGGNVELGPLLVPFGTEGRFDLPRQTPIAHETECGVRVRPAAGQRLSGRRSYIQQAIGKVKVQGHNWWVFAAFPWQVTERLLVQPSVSQQLLPLRFFRFLNLTQRTWLRALPETISPAPGSLPLMFCSLKPRLRQEGLPPGTTHSTFQGGAPIGRCASLLPNCVSVLCLSLPSATPP